MVKCEFSECSTFGSLLRYATDFEETALELYGNAVNEKKVSGAAAELLSVLIEKHKKRLAELELARREKLREEILEPISDFDSEKYKPNCDIVDPLAQAIELEEKAVMYYMDASKRAKTLQGELANIYKRLGKQNEDFLSKLRAL